MAANVNSLLRRVARIGENARRSGREPITQRQQRQVAEFPIAESVRPVVLGAEMVEQYISISSEWIHRCAASGPVLLFLSTPPPELCCLGAAAAG